jgi:hypothetical protein
MRKVEKHGIYDGVKERNTMAYETWRNMLHRCYNDKYLQKNPSYIGCEVIDEWKTFSVFKKWFNDNYINGYQLDKDLLGNGRLYSPSTCCFIPKKINTFLSNKQRNNTSGAIGVCFFRGKYLVHSKNMGVNKSHGSYNSLEDAKKAYKEARQNNLNKLIEEYSFLQNKILTALAEKGVRNLV